MPHPYDPCSSPLDCSRYLSANWVVLHSPFRSTVAFPAGDNIVHVLVRRWFGAVSAVSSYWHFKFPFYVTLINSSDGIGTGSLWPLVLASW
jgi:hypothetical protein